MNKRKLDYTWFLLILLIICLLAGCIALPGSESPSATKTQVASRLTLKPCTVGSFARAAECGAFRVPEDRSHPEGRMLDLAVVIVPAREANPEPDPLFYVAGGPGTAATSTGYVNNANGIFSEINTRRAVVFLDQRGTNDKHLLACENPTFSLSDAPSQQVNDWMKNCLSHVDGDPRFYTTTEAMRDLDEARAALGYDKINLYGLSYGATAIQVYLRMFPEHVRTSVLDHGTALDITFTEARPRAVQSALEQVITYCEQDEKCHVAYPNIRGEWKALLERLKEGPVITNFTVPGETTPVKQTLDDVAVSARNLLLDSGSYAAIPSLIHLFATTEDWTPIAEKNYNEQHGASEPSGPVEKSILMNDMISCFEPWVGYDAEAIDRLNQGSFYWGVEVNEAKIMQKICPALPKPDPSLIYPPSKLSPLHLLIINSLLDPQNPPSNMVPALKEFPQSRIIIEPTQGHDPTDYGCRWDVISQYIQKGLPEGLDTSCMEKVKPSFVVGSD